MKAIMISDKPKWCAKMMNGDKLIEVRKNKALAKAIQKLIDKYGYADIYVCCTKGKREYLFDFRNDEESPDKFGSGKASKWFIKNNEPLNGKVVFKFRCYKVDTIWKTTTNIWTYGSDLEPNFYKESCLNDIELNKYLKPIKVGFNYQYGHAIHISQLKIFDKPKGLWEFKVYRPNACDKCWCEDNEDCILNKNCPKHRSLTKAPQNFCYVEVEL